MTHAGRVALGTAPGTSTREGAWWQDMAACAGMDVDLFFPERSDNRGERAAKAVCRQCPVIDICRETYMDQKWGVFGGLTAEQRARVRRRRRGSR